MIYFHSSVTYLMGDTQTKKNWDTRDRGTALEGSVEKLLGDLNFFYLCETSPLILMRLQIENLCSVHIEKEYPQSIDSFWPNKKCLNIWHCDLSHTKWKIWAQLFKGLLA